MDASRILIIGGSSYIGQALSICLDDGYEVFSTFYTRDKNIRRGKAICLDVRDSASLTRVLKEIRPHVVFLFSYSLDDLNGTVVQGASRVMESARLTQSKVILLSTDAVFGGRKNFYHEHDVPEPINEYGRAKRDAEKIVLENNGYVIRTSLVYGYEPADPRTLQLIRELQNGVTKTAYFLDEFRCPIFIQDLCHMLESCIGRKTPRLLHIVGPECLSRLNFARILASAFGFDDRLVCSAPLRPELKRPPCLCLDATLAQKVLGYRIRSPKEVLAHPDIKNADQNYYRA